MKANLRHSVLLAGLSALLFSLTLSHNYLPDGLQFALAIEAGERQALWQPNHMLYPQVAIAFHRSWGVLGYNGRILLPLQMLDVLAGAAGVGLMYAVAARVTGKTRSGAVAAVGLMASHGYWLYSSDAEVVVLPLALSLATLGLMVVHLYPVPREIRPGSWMALTASVILGILLLQTGVFLIPPVAMGLWAARGNARGLWRHAGWVAFVLAVSAVTVGAYALVRTVVFGAGGLVGLLAWPGQYALPGSFSLRQLVHGGYAALRTLAGFYSLGIDARTISFLAQAVGPAKLAFFAFYALVGAGVAGLAFLAWRARSRLSDRHRELLVILGLWMAGYGAFALYWMPGDVQFWSPLLIPFWLLVALVLEAQGRPQARPGIGIGLAVCGLAVSNLLQVAVPNTFAARNLALRVAESIRDRTTPADLVVTGGGDALFLYVPYFSQRPTVVLSHLVLQTPGRDRRAALDRLNVLVAEAERRGGRAYLVNIEKSETTPWAALAGPGTAPGDFQALNTGLAWEVAGVEVFRIWADLK